MCAKLKFLSKFPSSSLAMDFALKLANIFTGKQKAISTVPFLMECQLLIFLRRLTLCSLVREVAFERTNPKDVEFVVEIP